MKITKNVIVPEKTISDTIGVKCDICGIEKHSVHCDWGDGHYDVDKIEISRVVGTRYPGDYDVERLGFDICPDCWDAKLIPWMASQGAEPE
jgi:hypothetical protein